MSEYAHMESTAGRRSIGGEPSRDASRPSRASGGQARAADAGLAAALHGTARVRSLFAMQRALDTSARVRSQRSLQRALNPDFARPVQRKPLAHGLRVPQAPAARPASGPQSVVQRLWFDTGAGVMWIPDDALDLNDLEQTGARHDAEDEHPAGPVWRLKPTEKTPIGGVESESVLDEEPEWFVDEGAAEGILPGTVSVKDLTTNVPALVGPTEAWGGKSDFGDLGWDQPLSQARVSVPVFPQVHVSFWCKVGDIDVKVHLTKAGYAVIYDAGDAPGEKAQDITKEGLTGKDLYAEFLKIATLAGGYREGANECQTFANAMLQSLTKTVEDNKEEKNEKKEEEKKMKEEEFT